MAVDKELWKKSFGALDPSQLPSWPCPSCGKTQVVLENKTLIYRRNKVQYRSDDFNKEDFEERSFLGVVIALATAYEKLQFVQHKFVGFLICKDCGEAIGFGGRAEVPRETANRPTYLSTRLYPEYFSPPLPFFSLDARYPASVRQNFVRSFGLAFNDAASSANAIRQGVECLLDEMAVPKLDERKSRLSLFDRIKKLGEKNAEVAVLLDGIRFLGNEGSHTGKVVREDLIRAFEVIEHVLDEIFIRSEARKKVLESSKGLAETYKPNKQQ
jgi:hypothetical protein